MGLPAATDDTAHAHHHDHGDSCAHAQARSAAADGALHAAETACRKRGARLTPIRREVLEALVRTHRPMGAYDLAEALKGRGGRALAPITIYRALDFLIEQGFVHRLASRNAFVACPHAQGPHEHGPHELVAFLICETCGGVDEMPSQAVAQALGSMLRSAEFEPRTQVLEISGICAHCREPGPAA